jgi:hypothetical protein
LLLRSCRNSSLRGSETKNEKVPDAKIDPESNQPREKYPAGVAALG